MICLVFIKKTITDKKKSERMFIVTYKNSQSHAWVQVFNHRTEICLLKMSEYKSKAKTKSSCF